MAAGVALAGLSITDPPERWAALGFVVGPDTGRVLVGGVRITLGIAPPGRGIAGWTLDGLAAPGDVDGLPTARGERPRREISVPVSPNGVVGVDHVVVRTSDLERLDARLADRGLALTRRAHHRGRAMGFRRLANGPILEVVEAPDAETTAFWGVAFAVAGSTLDEVAADHPHIGAPRPAVQPGRRIASVSPHAGLSTRVAFIDAAPVDREADEDPPSGPRPRR